jgi:2-oxoglutarate dehydrogenase E2 component (dihydrolipoamide succinyltransferase)
MAVELKVPSVGESVSEVMVVDWIVTEGDSVSQDDPLVELETDKATMEVPAPFSGRLTRIVLKAGDSAQIGDVLGYLEEGDEEPGSKKDEKPAESKKESEKKKEESAKEKEEKKDEDKEEPVKTEEKKPQQKAESGQEKVMPAARRLIDQENLGAEDIQPTGPGGRLLKEDVLRYLRQRDKGGAEKPEEQPPQTAAFREEEVKPLSPMRLKIAERLVHAQNQAALLSTFNEADMSAVMAIRKEYQEDFQEKYNIKLGLMSFFVKAVIDALKKVPQLNARIDGKKIVYHNFYDIGVAVASGKGLVVPVIRNAERLSFSELEKVIRDFAGRAKENKVEISELEGGTFTITNGGIFGSMLSTPIINPPQSGILGMHAIQERPVVREGEVVIRPMMNLALTYDHRIVDGREGAIFLARVKECIEDPTRMLVEI